MKKIAILAVAALLALSSAAYAECGVKHTASAPTATDSAETPTTPQPETPSGG